MARTDGDNNLYVREVLVASPTVNGGTATAPAAGAVVADTGALTAGSYRLEVTAGFADTLAAGKGLLVEHRDAANTATVRTLAIIPAGVANSFEVARIVVAASERVRIVNAAIAGAAGSVAAGSIRAYAIS